MDIRQMAVAGAASLPNVDKDKSSQPQEAGSDAFSLLLQGAQPEALPLTLEGVLERTAPVEVLEAPVLQQLQEPPLSWSVDSLLAQAQGVAAEIEPEAGAGAALMVAVGPAASPQLAETLPGTVGRWSGQPAQLPTAIGQTVSIVASGVQSTLPAEQLGVAASVVAAADAAGVSDAALTQLEQPLGEEVESEGRLSLQGAWRLQDPEAAPPPGVQRLLGQIEQWAAAAAGVQRKPDERAGAVTYGADDGTALGQMTGSGTRLTEQAVREAQAGQAMGDEHSPEAPTEDMRFWLQGRQQRAEVVLDRHGQALRVQVSISGNEAHVTLRSDQAQTRDLLGAGLDQLRTLLQAQGLELAGVSVQADAQSSGSGSGGGAREPAPGWGAERAQHASVAVPVAMPAGSTARAGHQGLDLYA